MQEEVQNAPVNQEAKDMLPNMQFKNKYAKGDNVWAVFSIGENVKINQLEIKAFVAEVSPAGTRYLYGFTLDGKGHNNGVNMTFLSSDLVFFDRQEAKERAIVRVEDLKKNFDNSIMQVNAQRNETMVKFDGELAKLRAMKEKCNADNLDVEPLEQKAEPVTPEMTPDKEQSNLSDDGEPNKNPEN